MDPEESEIHKVARILSREISATESQLREKQLCLRMLQRCCDHAEMELYRERLTGVCPNCLYNGLTKSEIDTVFS